MTKKQTYTIIFDWDGTLHNTKHLYGRAFRTAYSWLVEQGYEEEQYYSDDDISIYLGMNAVTMWNLFRPNLPDEIKQHCSEIITKHMTSEVRAGAAVLYDGALEVLQKLKDEGHRLLFLSNCKHQYMEAHRDTYHLDDYFKQLYCCQDYNFIPKEDIFSFIKEDYDGPYLAIGDRAGDLKIAQVHGFSSIGCAYGFGTAEELSMADKIVHDVRELPGAIAEI